jgi:MFS family permease
MPEPLFTRRFVGMWVFAFITFFSAFQLLPVIPRHIVALGGTKAQAGWFLSVYTFASALAAPVMGTIADQLGRKRMLVSASVLFAVFSVLYAVVEHIPLLLVIALVHGCLWSGLMSSSSAIMSGYIPEARRTQGLAYWGVASTAAIGVAPLAGLLIQEYGGWRMLCGELAGLSLIMFVWSSRLDVEQPARIKGLPSIRTAWDWRVIKAAAALAVIAFGYGGMTSYVALLSAERHIEPPWLFFTVYAMAIILIRVFTSHLGDRYGPKPVLYPSFAVIPFSFVMLAIARTPWQIGLSGALFGIGLGAAYPAFANFILTNTDPSQRARSFGSIVWAFDTGIGSGSLLIGAMAQRWGYGRAFGVAAAISCVAIPIFVAASRAFAGTAVAQQ